MATTVDTTTVDTVQSNEPLDDREAFGLQFVEPAPTMMGGTTTTKTVTLPVDTDPEDTDM